MASSQPRRRAPPKLKPMFTKQADLSKIQIKSSVLTSATPVALSSKTVDTKSPTASQDPILSESQCSKNTEKEKEANDLDFWGRAKDVHAGMQKLDEEKRHKEAEARRQKAKATTEKKKEAPTRSSKRRKSDDSTAIILSDDDNNNDEKDSEYRPRKPSRGLTITPRTSVEPVDPSEIDKILAAYNKKKAEVDAEVAAKSRVFSPPLSTQLPGSQRENSADPNDASKDMLIWILIVSQIPGTKPMVFQRKFGQTLGKVRDTWARMQGLTDEQIENLVLVWQGETRVFDSTLPKSLGIRFNKDGRMYMNTKGRKENFATLDSEESQAIQNGINPGECKIYFDAMWDEDYSELLKRKEAAKERANALELSSDDEDDDGVVTGIALDVQMIDITLKGKHFEEMKLKVKPNMKVSEVIDRMRDERKLDEDTEIELHFDGEELEEDMTLEEADIEDEFQIDVVLR